ncbi:MAG: hypothetical protein K2Q21_12965 [Chitinophagaceae bacterium]|nr:hypothetical protein [Chitinophagaceae bacterium]
MSSALKPAITFFYISLSVFFSCQKNKLPNIDCSKKSNDITIVRNLIVGTWFWNRTQTQPNTVPPNIIIQTPTTEGYSQRLTFANGMVSKYKNDTLLFMDKYDVTYLNEVTGYQSDSSVIIIYKDIGTGQRRWFSETNICNDTVIFYNPFYDVRESWSR